MQEQNFSWQASTTQKKEGRKAESEIVHKFEIGLDDSSRIDSTGVFKSRSVSPQVCKSQKPEVRSFINAPEGLHHATSCLHSTRLVFLEVDPSRKETHNWQLTEKTGNAQQHFL